MKKLKLYLHQKLYFLLLLPVFFILHGYNAFFSFFPTSFVLAHLAAYTGLVILLYAISNILFRHKTKAAVFTYSLALLIFGFGVFHDLIKHSALTLLSKYSVLLPVLLSLLTIFFVLLKKKQSPLFRTVNFLNLLMIILFAYELSDSLNKCISYKKNNHLLDNRFNAYESISRPLRTHDSTKPDIYLLIFDAMPSTKAMISEWQFDNSKLDSFLSREGFYVNSLSKSNYNLTVLSMVSMLNMDYTTPINLKQDETKMYFKASASLLDNSLTRFLKEQQYDVKQFQAISFQNKDWNGNCFFGDMLTNNYFYQTLPGRIYRDLGWQLEKFKTRYFASYAERKIHTRNQQMQINLITLKKMIEESCSKNKQQPQFVYAHFPLPHDPYIFDSSGNLKPPAKTVLLTEQEQSKAFMEQVRYSNKLIEHLISFIKKNNKTNSVIIVSGDHGYRNINGEKGYMIFDNFNSLYFPDGDYSQLYQSMSPVNTFRVIVNKYFKANLPILKDSSIFIPYTLPGNK